jgi:hypothetical protein
VCELCATWNLRPEDGLVDMVSGLEENLATIQLDSLPIGKKTCKKIVASLKEIILFNCELNRTGFFLDEIKEKREKRASECLSLFVLTVWLSIFVLSVFNPICSIAWEN